MSPTPEPMPEHTERRALRLLGIFFAIVIVGIVTFGVATRAAQHTQVRNLTEDEATPTVAVVQPAMSANAPGLDLPGRIEAFIRAPIYARVAGYLKSWRYDIGAPVKAGAVLAEIETPDLDQQLLQARADLKVAEANARLAEISARRWQSLAGTDAVATQDVDQRTYAFNANVAQVRAAEANVSRLLAEEGFKRLVAPFDGIVTARETDVGALINVGAAGGAELFVVSSTKRVRVYVSVPQNFVPAVPIGTGATITVPERPGKTYVGTVEASAQAVNAGTGTTLMQVLVDNPAGELMPGGYASVRLQVAAAQGTLAIPSSALIFDSKGLSVATVDGERHVRLKKVVIMRDLGPMIELSSGVSPKDQVIENPPDGIEEGDLVRLTHAPSSSAATNAPIVRNAKG